VIAQGPAHVLDRVGDMAKENEKKGPEINWVGAIGSGLGSVTSAVLLSTTGAAGTWIGAGIGTFIITVGGAIYGYYLQRAKTGIEKTADKLNLPAPPSKRGSSRADTKTITAEKDPNQPAKSQQQPDDEAEMAAEGEEKTKPTFKKALRNINWKRVGGWALVLFAITMGIIFVFELATGRPVSSYTGGTSPESTGTSITGVQDPAQGEDSQQDQEQDPLAPQQDPEQQPEEEMEQPEQVPGEEEPQPGEQLPEEDAPVPVEPQPEQAPEQQPQQQEEGIEAPQ